jgi:hypothetical protein
VIENEIGNARAKIIAPRTDATNFEELNFRVNPRLNRSSGCCEFPSSRCQQLMNETLQMTEVAIVPAEADKTFPDFSQIKARCRIKSSAT